MPKIRNRFLLKSIFVFLLVVINFSQAKEKNAGLAMLLCVFPGGGQYYTGRYIQGVLVSSAEIGLGYYAYKHHQDRNYDSRNSMLWWGLFVFGYSLADAYVGAKMYGFDVQTDLNKVSLNFRLKW